MAQCRDVPDCYRTRMSPTHDARALKPREKGFTPMNKRVRFNVHAWRPDPEPANMAQVDSGLNYFTCTLGEAAAWNADHPHPFHTVNHLIDEQAEDLRQRPAVNFPGGCFAEDGREIKSGA